MTRRMICFVFSVGLLHGCASLAGIGDDLEEAPPCKNRCENNVYFACSETGEELEPQACVETEICRQAHGCTECLPSSYTCRAEDRESWRCEDDGSAWTYQRTCEDNEVCAYGACVNLCDKARQKASTIGCDFWSADLDNEAITGLFTSDAAAQQFAVAIE